MKKSLDVNPMMTSEAEFLVEEEEDEIPAPVTYDIATYPSDFTLSGIAQMWADNDIIIPDFQREFVWSIKQSSLLIDSFLCGLPVPSVFFYIDESNKNLVIDGQQRIMTIVFFLDGYFGSESTHGKRQVFRLKGLSEKSPFYNKRFSDLEPTDQRKLKQAVLRAVNIRQLSPIGESTSAYHIFERLNTGGTPLTPQEIRNCVFGGELSAKLKAANKNAEWRKILGKPVVDRHHKDTELILRTFSLVGDVTKYEKPMKEFLNNAMCKHQSAATPKAKKVFTLFPSVTELVATTLGPTPFHLRGPLNASALDSVLCVLFESFDQIDRKTFRKKFQALLDDEHFRDYTQLATTDAKTVHDRVKLVRKYLLP
jgi:Protein of unknown function DUF262